MLFGVKECEILGRNIILGVGVLSYEFIEFGFFIIYDNIMNYYWGCFEKIKVIFVFRNLFDCRDGLGFVYNRYIFGSEVFCFVGCRFCGSNLYIMDYYSNFVVKVGKVFRFGCEGFFNVVVDIGLWDN